MKIKKNDTVKIIAGKDKGKSGKVSQVFPKLNKVVVEGLNIRFRHLGPRRQNEKGQRIEYAAPMDASNVMVVDPKTGKPTRLSSKKLDSGEKIRLSKKSNEAV